LPPTPAKAIIAAGGKFPNMSERRKLAAILAADVVGYSRLAGADEERTLARLRALWGDLLDPAVAAHHGRVVKRTGDGALVEFRSVVDAVRCAIEIQNGMAERNAGVQKDRKIEFRIGIHLGDVVEEADGDLMGDGVNIAARLEGIAQPGAICLSEDAYRQVRSRVEFEAVDLGEQRLKNIAHPVRAYALHVGLRAPPRSVPAPPTKKPRSRTTPIAAALAALIVVAAAAWYYLGAPSPLSQGVVVSNPPAHLSIVVLPFVNLSGDPKQDYFADGITDNLTIELSRVRNAFVIAHNTAYTFKGKTIDAHQIGQLLGVRYVLEGSVQRDGSRVRVGVQLVDAATNTELWADRFEEEISDLFKLQDRIVARLANSLGNELVKAEAVKGAHSKNPDAIDLDMRGAEMLQQSPTKDGNAAARNWFEQALVLDPDDADALSGNAMTYVFDYAFGWGKSDTDYDGLILGRADRALALAPNNVKAYAAKSFYLYVSHRPEESLRAADAGLAINPNYAPLYAARRGAELSLGRYAEAKADMEQAMRLSPRDPDTGTWHMYMGDAELGPGNFDAAIAEYQKAIEAGYRTFIPYADMAAAQALAGRMDEAKAALAEARRLNPALTIKWEMAHAPDIPNLFAGLRKAGLPEDDAPAPKQLSIVVLPFQNLGGDQRQDYLADVLTDALTTYISRIPGSFVIARNTAFTYKGKPTDAKQIGKELGVRYALEGSVQPTDALIRTNAQLIDIDTGAHLWAEQFDNDKGDLLQTEDEIVTRLARTLQIQLADIEADKLKRASPANPDAQELALRCQVATWSRASGKEAEAGYQLCEQALKIDPDNVVALTTLSSRYYVRAITMQSADRQADVTRADELGARALVLDPNNPDVHSAKAGVLIAQGQFERAQIEAERALELNPSQMNAYNSLCLVGFYLGQPEKMLTCDDKALRLSPRDPVRYVWIGQKGTANAMLGRDGEAVQLFRNSLAINPNYVGMEPILAGTLALSGQEFEAHEIMSRYLGRPHVVTTIAAFERQSVSNNPNYLAYRARLSSGMRKAGMPEK
jgi:adenylate cyclase